MIEYTTKYMISKGWKFNPNLKYWYKDESKNLHTLREAAYIQMCIDEAESKKRTDDIEKAGNVQWLIMEGWTIIEDEGRVYYECPWNSLCYSYNEALTLQEKADKGEFYFNTKTIDWLIQRGWVIDHASNTGIDFDPTLRFISPRTQAAYTYNQAVRVQLDHQLLKTHAERIKIHA